MSDEDWLELDEKALATIQLFLTREVLREVIHETTAAGLWLKLESLYLTKSLANKLWLKDRLYTFRMKPRLFLYLLLTNTLKKSCCMATVKHYRLMMLNLLCCPKQKYDDDVEPESSEGLLKNKLEREGKGNNEKKPEKAAEVAIAKGDSDGDVYLAIDTKKSKDELIVDSGCTFHMIPHQSWFTTYESFNGGNVYMGNHSICPVIRKGNIQVKMHDGVVRTITRVRQVPDLKRNLDSLSTLRLISLCNVLYVEGTVVYGTAGVATSKASLDDSKLWHYRLGHMGEKGMKYLAKKGLIKVSCNLEFCEHCVFGKQKKVSFSPGIHRTRDALDYIHSDLWGPSPVTSRGGKRYMLTIIDDFSRKVWVFFLKHKDEVFPTFKEWKVLIENQTGKKIKKLRTDNGLEFCGESFNDLY
ncbi:retrovirus-related pol polyprotein from transposon TNT 1-94 [Tanacetum coccineum]